MTLPVTGLYAALVALLFIVLSLRVVRQRRAARVALGTGGDRALEARIRAQGNCAEYAPMGLILLALTEANGAPGAALHLLGLLLLAGRILHAVALARADLRLRVAGMGLTFAMLGLSAAGLLAHVLI